VDGFYRLHPHLLGDESASVRFIMRTLVDGSEAAGSHDASWDGLDDAGRSVEAGSYFYRMRAMGPSGQSLERSKKVQLVR
jgi:flagellar hook assembly protein FlgD